MILFSLLQLNNFSFKECPQNIKENRAYSLSGKNNNILTKTGNDFDWAGAICENELESSIEEHKWKIKILKSKKQWIMIGVAPSDFDINSSSYNTCGWYIGVDNSCLYSGPPLNFNGAKTKLSKIKDEIVVIMNMKKRALKFIINNEDNGDSYTNIPIDKPLYPAVCLYNKNDWVEISEYQ